MNGLDQFAGHAATFRRTIAESRAAGAITARSALQSIATLYLAALDLPAPWTDTDEDARHEDRVTDEEYWSLVQVFRTLPFRYYGKVFDGTVVPAEAPVEADIADDLADIYRDVETGLRAFEAGRRDAALWEWAFGFRHHWGRHASSAIAALHGWLTENDPESLSPAASGDHGAAGR